MTKPAAPAFNLVFNRAFDPAHGEAVRLSDHVARVTAGNPGPFTFHGTNSYLVGTRELAVIDPGPQDAAHHDALIRAIAGRPVKAILLTHTHRDHSTGARTLAGATGAPILAEGPHRPSRPVQPGEDIRLDASGDMDLVPDRRIGDGERLAVDGLTLEVIATPGHAANHLAFALLQEASLFSGDHVMAWSTSIVAPPDGSMAAYMASLERLMARAETRYYPGHGADLADVPDFLARLHAHRKGREQAILDRLARGDRAIPDMVAAIYADTPAALHGAAGLSVLAHLEDLAARRLVLTDAPPRLDGLYRPA